MDSTACLLGSDAPHVDLFSNFVPSWHRDMEEDNPITRHLKPGNSRPGAGLLRRV
jgi:hypothetical protein